MSQRISDCDASSRMNGQDLALDLLSLRAAVRAVHRAEEAYSNMLGDVCAPPELIGRLSMAISDNRDALRAEMAGIDGKTAKGGGAT